MLFSASFPFKYLWFLAPLAVAMAVVIFVNPTFSDYFGGYFNSKSLNHDRAEGIIPNNSSQFPTDDGVNKKPVRNEDRHENVTKIGINDDQIPRASEKNRQRYSNLEFVEADLAQARAAIKEAVAQNQTLSDPDYVPDGPMYWNPKLFQRSYFEMEKRLKVFIYEEGEPPVFHFGRSRDTYAIEGIFIEKMEISRFRTFDPNKAHLFFLPISMTIITELIHVYKAHDWPLMKNTALDYVTVISQKHPYWNRSLGADHFIIGCHDFAPNISFVVPNLHKHGIRALCNANTSEQFNPSQDVSIPEVLMPGGRITPDMIGGPPPSKRPTLVFYAGRVHGPIRRIFLRHWENKNDSDVKIYRYLPQNVSYHQMMRESKYCVSPSGYEVANPRTMEGLYHGCVPVLINDGYVTPFSDVLNWETFAVIVPVKDIPNLKKTLMRIPVNHYVEMQKRGIQLRRHFEINSPPKRYDVFHMILHSIWLRRLNVRLQDERR